MKMHITLLLAALFAATAVHPNKEECVQRVQQGYETAKKNAQDKANRDSKTAAEKRDRDYKAAVQNSEKARRAAEEKYEKSTKKEFDKIAAEIAAAKKQWEAKLKQHNNDTRHPEVKEASEKHRQVTQAANDKRKQVTDAATEQKRADLRADGAKARCS
ncbi:MAG TPA: hypothetical protein PLF85_17250, partial [Turneriella sp.]|nr:hypothetical protein [Turneriella sp.]